MSYNMSVLRNASTIPKLLSYANASADNMLLTLFIWAVFFIMVFKLKSYDFDAALLISSFSCFVIAMIFNYLNMLNIIIPLVFAIVAGITAMYMVMSKSG